MFEFREALYLLRKEMAKVARHPDEKSILGTILEGNYDSFRIQREHLARLHVERFGHCAE